MVQLIASDSWNESSANYEEMLTKEGLKEISTYADAIGPWLNQLYVLKKGEIIPNNVVSNAHEAGLKVHPYTHRLEQLPKGMTNKMFLDFVFDELEVDGIFSDYADLVVKYLD